MASKPTPSVNHTKPPNGAWGANGTCLIAAADTAPAAIAAMRMRARAVASYARVDVAAIRKLSLRVNGRARTVEVDPERKLLDVLRNELRLTSAKYGCGEAQCGACTVLRDGKAVRSCTLPVGRCEGVAITTLEGLGSPERLHPLQRAFIDEGAMQCGYCTAGMIMAGVALLGGEGARSSAQVAKAMRGNICRCGTYPRIVRAILRAGGEEAEG